ncbi:HaeIII family restriction endonuclease [Apibacter muscae]|uniref:HaeIII family restriction endonuclease n=1 Tax=Apibacter muscae TaxID=2509004 RepID=UPI0011AD0115|nr:HaeIII family restriction endonuclease [Apibacter muscae]TWP23091.1 HaeIII family restriction endonuclease [Apibacter muscae]
MSYIPNLNGRALEYIVTKTLIDKYECILDDKCKYMQFKDEEYFNKISYEQQLKYIKASITVGDYLERIYKIHNSMIIRLTDYNAKSHNSDVTDICIMKNNEEVINISLKNNHNAIKHNRPGSLAQQCGFQRKSYVDIEYRECYKFNIDLFIKKINENFNDIKLFKDIKSESSDFINHHLYFPICQNTVEFINTHVKNNENNTNYLFSFLIGSKDFIKIILKDKLEITNFYQIKKPSSVEAELHSNSYVYLTFDNNYKISMRLHTASSKIQGVSLKFDSRIISSNLETEFVEI